MIYDKISNWGTYFDVSKFSTVFDTLNEFTVNTENGSYQFDGFYVKVMSYDTRFEPEIIESHEREVDIQILLSGEEKIKLYHLEDLMIKDAYKEDTDCTFYYPKSDPYAEIYLKPGYMAVFFPSDPHHPQFVAGKNPVQLKKIVVKVNLQLFQ